MFSSACSAFSVAASCWATGALFTFSWLERLSGGCGGGGWGRGGRPLPCRWNEAGGGGRPGFSGRSGLLDPGWLVQRTGAVVTVGMGGLLEERTWPYMGGLSGLSGGGPSGRSGGGPLGRSWRGLLGFSGFSGGIGGRFGTTGRSRLFRSPATFSNFSSGGETVTEGVTGAHSVVGAISGIVFSWLGWRSGGMGGNGAGGLRVTRRCILGLKRSELRGQRKEIDIWGSEYTCMLGNVKIEMAFSIISPYWNGTGSWNPPLRETSIHVSYSCYMYPIVADDLMTQGAKTSAAMILT